MLAVFIFLLCFLFVEGALGAKLVSTFYYLMWTNGIFLGILGLIIFLVIVVALCMLYFGDCDGEEKFKVLVGMGMIPLVILVLSVRSFAAFVVSWYLTNNININMQGINELSTECIVCLGVYVFIIISGFFINYSGGSSNK